MISLKALIGLRLQSARKSAGFRSARDFANKANIPITTYNQHESGKRSIKIEMLVHYCDLLSIDINWFIFGGDKPYISKKTQDSLLLLASNTTDQLHLSGTKKSHIILKKDDSKVLLDIKLYNQIIISIIRITREFSIPESEAVDFCIDVYNSIITTSANEEDIKKMIELSISSLKLGCQQLSLASKRKRTSST